MPIEVSSTNEEQIKVYIAPVTSTGKPAKVDGTPIWEVVSGPAKVNAASDGLSADLVSDTDDLSDTIVKVSADANLGDGVEEVADTITYHVLHANATSLGLTADTPVPKP